MSEVNRMRPEVVEIKPVGFFAVGGAAFKDDLTQVKQAQGMRQK